jgi:hypothetical protein
VQRRARARVAKTRPRLKLQPYPAAGRAHPLSAGGGGVGGRSVRGPLRLCARLNLCAPRHVARRLFAARSNSRRGLPVSAVKGGRLRAGRALTTPARARCRARTAEPKSASQEPVDAHRAKFDHQSLTGCCARGPGRGARWYGRGVRRGEGVERGEAFLEVTWVGEVACGAPGVRVRGRRRRESAQTRHTLYMTLIGLLQDE